MTNLYHYALVSSRTATILYGTRQVVEAMWGRLVTCSRLVISPVAAPNLFSTGCNGLSILQPVSQPARPYLPSVPVQRSSK
jgi:hypothetical protein